MVGVASNKSYELVLSTVVIFDILAAIFKDLFQFVLIDCLAKSQQFSA